MRGSRGPRNGFEADHQVRPWVAGVVIVHSDAEVEHETNHTECWCRPALVSAYSDAIWDPEGHAEN